MPPLVILAGGAATRLGELGVQRPKSLVPVCGEPFLKLQLALLTAAGFREVIFCLGHLGEAIRDYVGSGEDFGIKAHYSDDGEKLLGTGGALRKALSSIQLPSQECAIIYGDSYLPIDYSAVVDSFHRLKQSGIVTVFQGDVAGVPANTEVEHELVVAYDKEHPTESMKYIDYGFMIFKISTILESDYGGPFDMSVWVKQLAAEKKLAAFEVAQRFYEVGTPEGIATLEQYLAQTTRQPERRQKS
jgi:NDP-sugar pyrophosphorylase family protein